MSGDERLVRALVACYPAGWRRRYGDEYAELLCDMRVHRRPALILDSLFGAVRAHGGVVVSRRSPMTAVVWATALFTVAGIGFAKLAEDFTGRGSGSYALLVAGAAAALLALAVAAAPTAAALVRGQDAGAWKYVAVPVAGTALWFGVLRLALAIGGHTAPNVAGFALIAAAGIAVLAATAWAAVTVLVRVPGRPPARLRPVAATIVAAGMAVATIAAVIWGLQVRSADPSGFRGDHGFLATPFLPSWIAVVIALAAATAVAAQSTRRQLALGR